MSYETQWLIPEKIVHLSCKGEISGIEMEAALANVRYLLTQSSLNEVHLIIDLTNMGTQSALVDIAKTIRNMRPIENMGWLITIGDMSPVLKMAFSTAIQLMDKRMRQFATIHESIDFLKDMLIDTAWDDFELNAIPETKS